VSINVPQLTCFVKRYFRSLPSDIQSYEPYILAKSSSDSAPQHTDCPSRAEKKLVAFAIALASKPIGRNQTQTIHSK